MPRPSKGERRTLTLRVPVGVYQALEAIAARDKVPMVDLALEVLTAGARGHVPGAAPLGETRAVDAPERNLVLEAFEARVDARFAAIEATIAGLDEALKVRPATEPRRSSPPPSPQSRGASRGPQRPGPVPKTEPASPHWPFCQCIACRVRS